MSRRRSEEITFAECFWFPVSTAQARRDVVTGGTLLFTLIFGWIWNMGHRLEVVCRLYHHDAPYFRGFAPWGRTFCLGLRAFVAIALYQAPGLALMFLGLLFSVHGDDWLVFGLGGTGLALFVIATYALPGGMTYNAAFGDMSYLYRPDKALRNALAGGLPYLKAWVISLAAIALSFLGLLALGIGFFYTSVWAWSVVGYAFSLALLPDLPRITDVEGGDSELSTVEHLPQRHRGTEMIKGLVVGAVLFAMTALGVAQEVKPRYQRPVSTYSIVARDAKTGEFGAAVQSHWFCVGCIVIWAEAGVGAVATQSFVDPSYGKLGLEMMKLGRGAPETLKGLLEADTGNAVRQVAMIDRTGRVAVWTGAKDIAAAGHIAGGRKGGDAGSCGVEAHSNIAGCFATGVEFSVQANLMENDKVWPAMAKAFESTEGDLAERMLAALEAAQAVGGDIRGKQSAALIVVSGKPTGKPWVDRTFDLRVDDHPEPLKELRKLVAVNRAYNHMNAGDLAVEHKDNEGALREYAAAEKIASTTPGFEPTRLAEMKFWHAVALVNMGRVDDSLPVFQEAFKIHPAWRELVPRLPKSGVLPDDKKVIERIVGKSEKQ